MTAPAPTLVHPAHLHATANPEEGDCCLCGTEDGSGCAYVTAEQVERHARWQADIDAYFASLPPETEAPW